MKKTLIAILMILVGVCAFCMVGCNAETEEIIIGTPDGAPAFAFAELMTTAQEYETKAEVKYDIVTGGTAAQTVGAKLTSGDYDMAVLPSNVAANLKNGNINLKVLGTVTWGNLYLINKSGTMADLSALNGKTVYSISTSGIPYELFKYLLAQNNLSIATDQDIQNDELDGKVVVVGTTAPLIIQNWDTIEYAIVAEPALTNILNKKASAKIGYDFQDAYAAISSTSTGYPQAVLVAKESFITNNKKFVKDFVAKLSSNNSYLDNIDNITAFVQKAKEINEATGLASVKKVETVTRCNMNFVQSAQCKAEVTAFLANLGLTVDDSFYYEF